MEVTCSAFGLRCCRVVKRLQGWTRSRDSGWGTAAVGVGDDGVGRGGGKCSGWGWILKTA